jgi:hypothetical protein
LDLNIKTRLLAVSNAANCTAKSRILQRAVSQRVAKQPAKRPCGYNRSSGRLFLFQNKTKTSGFA